MSRASSSDDLGDWLRLSPLAVVFFSFGFIRQLVANAVPAVVGGAAWMSTLDGYWADRLTRVGISVTAIAVLYGTASYLRFRYRMEPTRVVLQRGVFQREDLSIELSRIQNVNIRQPFYAAWFGLSFVELETAGSSGREISLAGIPYQTATDFREIVMAQQVDTVNDEPGEQDVVSGTTLHRSTAKDLVAYGLANPSLVFTAAFGVFVGRYVDEYAFSSVDFFGISAWIAEQRSAYPEFEFIAGAFIVVAVVVFFLLVTIAASFIRFHQYQLTLRGDTFRRVSGLLTTEEQSLRRRKIQTLVVRQNPVLKLFKRANLELRQAAAGDSEYESGGQNKTRRFIVPGVPEEDVETLAAQIMPGIDLMETRYSRPHPRIIRKVFWIAPPLLIAALAIGYFQGLWTLIFPPLIMIAAALIIQRWRMRSGFKFYGNLATFRRGFIGYRTVAFQIHKCQRTDLKQSPSQRRHQLASFSLHLASGSVAFPYAEYSDALRATDLCLHAAETSHEPWL